MASESYKLLIDSTDASTGAELLHEQINGSGDKKLHMHGVFGMCGVKKGANRNGRVYDYDEMVSEVARYKKEVVDEGMALGECEHPNTPQVSLRSASHRITDLNVEKDGTIIGKAVILEGHPMGIMLKSVFDSGGKVGISSRCLGQLQESQDSSGNKYNYVTGIKLVTFDSVLEPSCSTAVLDPLLESKEWFVNGDEYTQKPFEKLEKSLSSLPRKNQEQYLVECWKNFLKDIKV